MLSDGQNFCSVIRVNNQDRDYVSNEIHLVEYLGLAVDEQQQMIDMQKNPGMCNHHLFTFDYVYGIGCN